jgi:hypothetical protein
LGRNARRTAKDSKDFDFDLTGNGQLMRHFHQGNDMVSFEFKKPSVSWYRGSSR